MAKPTAEDIAAKEAAEVEAEAKAKEVAAAEAEKKAADAEAKKRSKAGYSVSNDVAPDSITPTMKKIFNYIGEQYPQSVIARAGVGKGCITVGWTDAEGMWHKERFPAD